MLDDVLADIADDEDVMNALAKALLDRLIELDDCLEVYRSEGEDSLRSL